MMGTHRFNNNYVFFINGGSYGTVNRRFTLSSNEYLSRDCVGYYRDLYLRFREPGKPDFLNTLKNTLNNYCPSVPKSARQEVYDRVKRIYPIS